MTTLSDTNAPIIGSAEWWTSPPEQASEHKQKVSRSVRIINERIQESIDSINDIANPDNNDDWYHTLSEARELLDNAKITLTRYELSLS